jgi:hypothetical protein
MKNARIVPLVVALGFGLFLSACGTPSNQENASTPSSLADPTNLQASAVAGNGLNAEYFSSIDFTGPSLKRIVPNVNFDFGAAAPIPGINANIFSIRFSGELSAPSSGTYTFFVTGSDGNRLNINNKIVLEDYTNHLPRTATGTIALIAGQKVPLKLEYFKNTGTGSLKLEWSGPGVARQVVPMAQLFAVVPPVVQPGVFYLAPNGDNNNPGTEALPWKTLGHAAYTLKPGQTVLVKNGTYTESLYIYNSGTPGKPITYKALPGARPKIEIRTSPNEGIIIQGASSTPHPERRKPTVSRWTMGSMCRTNPVRSRCSRITSTSPTTGCMGFPVPESVRFKAITSMSRPIRSGKTTAGRSTPPVGFPCTKASIMIRLLGFTA